MHSFSISNEINKKSTCNFFCTANNVIEWYGTPPYCAILRIKISNKISHKLITFFFPKELKRIHYESQINEFKSQRLQFLLFQKLLNIVKLKLWKCFDNIVLLSTLMLRCPLSADLSLLYNLISICTFVHNYKNNSL